MWTGLFDAVRDLTNREELIFAETGEIEKIGEHVTSLKEGDRVIVFQKKGLYEEKDV